jgi:hypothetical protein
MLGKARARGLGWRVRCLYGRRVRCVGRLGLGPVNILDVESRLAEYHTLIQDV